ncbi:MAG: hypothetical protein ACI4V1_10900 [Eubacteriales bacterium]
MKCKRIPPFAALAAAAVFLLQATSCGFIIVNDMTDLPLSETAASAEEAAETERYTAEEYTRWVGEDNYTLSRRYLAELPERDYGGAVFFITTPTKDYIDPDDTGTQLNRRIVERNEDVAEQFDVTLITSVTDASTMLSELTQAVAADTYYTDLLMVPVYLIGQFRAADTLINMRTLPFFDIEQPYFNQESSDMTSGGYATYGVAGDACISPSAFSAVYMNKTILEEAGADPYVLYRSVIDGTWTWDALMALTEAVRTGNDERAAAGLPARYTITTQNPAERLTDLVFKSAGNDYIKTGRRAIPVIGYTAKSVQGTMDVLAALYSDSYAITDASAGAVNCFSGGESAFLVDYLYVMAWMTNASADWGVLPLPKGDEGDEYRTLISNTELVFAVPKNHTNGEVPAILLSALNAASYGYLYDEYVEHHMIEILRDNDSVNMLDLILDTASFDFALAFGNAYPTVADATYRLIRSCAADNNLEDFFSERRTAAQETLSKYFPLRP